ncbi:DUF309 domain-containing protein [Paenibacillus harenae]|uniref:DUF309 domain-containing protein n=1 Tax=Paenibacillus harenae TaxID=306543 RepID=UPI0027944EE8|nr:DUF309 domain-containing protein [Paenibacillus harenae]MDQ0058064.1 putative metal-dependent hydrolase [Paenibacillus harenae]
MNNIPDSYVSFLVEFHATRDLFECHELLEEYWKEHPNDGMSDIWVGLIQLAVSLYHERRGNRKGAAMMLEQSRKRLSVSRLLPLGLDRERLIGLIDKRLVALAERENAQPYEDMNLPIVSEEIARRCEEQCAKRGLAWGELSPLTNDALIHRHKLRDRSEVIQARQDSLQAKQKERSG